MDWTDLLIDLLICSVAAFGGFVAGTVCGYVRGRHDVRGYYGSYRDEDAEIITRLRGEIIWLKAAIRRAGSELEKTEDSQYAQYFSDHRGDPDNTASICAMGIDAEVKRNSSNLNIEEK